MSSTVLDDGGLALLSERTGKMYRGNPTAAEIWSSIADHDGDIESVTDAIAAFYNVDPARVKADLDQLLSELTQARLVRTEP